MFNFFTTYLKKELTLTPYVNLWDLISLDKFFKSVIIKITR